MAFQPGDTPEERQAKVDALLAELRPLLLQADYWMWAPPHATERQPCVGVVCYAAQLEIGLIGLLKPRQEEHEASE